MKDKTTVLGIMSGSSLDGLDLCVSTFWKSKDFWKYRIKQCATMEFPTDIKTLLARSPMLSSEMLLELDVTFGKWIGRQINLIEKEFDLIAIHGHTVFHQPENGISLQIGNGEIIHHQTKTPTVANFRNFDIHLGGQGAPLVPMGEKLLFPDFDGFLNLGGICNGSFCANGEWIAGDIGPCNQVSNFFANKLGHPFDGKGKWASEGQLNSELLDSWKSISFFNKPFPKSLGNQWVKDSFIKEYNCSEEDVLHTFSVFIAGQIAQVLTKYQPKRILITGGGAYNTFLIDQLRSLTDSEIVIPDNDLVEFKEALIFGLLGLLRLNGESNVLSSCTGASEDSCSGVIYSSDQNV